MAVRRALLLLATLAAAMALAPEAFAAPYSSHSQIHSCCTDASVEEAMFREAKESGAAYIRLDINMPAVFAPQRYAHTQGPLDLLFPPKPQSEGTDWTQMDHIAGLSRQYGLPVLGILLGSSEPAESCPARIDRQQLCPPADPARWGAQAAQVAARYTGVIDRFEIWNEPDGRWAFAGDPEDYGRLLSSSYGAIKAAAPAATIVLGGTMYPNATGAQWLGRALRTPGTDAARKFDIASIHLRGPISSMIRDMRARAAFLRSLGRSAPMWVTEHGYPGDSKWQRDPAYRGGERAQADYLAESLPSLALAGADQTFVTLRDGGGREFESEGILRGLGVPAFSRKVAWWAVRDAGLHWPVAPFRRRYVASRTRVRRPARGRRYRVIVTGRFRGPACAGAVRLTVRLRGGRLLVRRATVDPKCRYRRALALRRPRSGKVRISQRFSGNARTGPGDAAALRAELRPRAARHRSRR